MKQSRTHFGVLGLVAAVLVAVFFVGYFKPIRLGLDLQGGLEIVLKATPKKGQELTTEQLDQSVSVIRDRVDGLGVSEPEIRTQGADQIAVELPGIRNADEAVKVVGSTAQLRFYEFEKRFVGAKAFRSPYLLLNENKARAAKSLSKAETKLGKAKKKLEDAKTDSEKKSAKKAVKEAAYDEQRYLFDDKKQLVGGPASTQEQLIENYSDQNPDAPKALADGKLPKGWQVMLVPIGEVMLHGDSRGIAVSVDRKGTYDEDRNAWLLLEDKPGLTGSVIRQANAESGSGGWVTSMLFTRKGGKQFGKITGDIARAGALRGAPMTFAIVLDDEIKSTPQIDYQEYPNGIIGNSAQITGLDSREEAQSLALVLNTGSLPVRFEILSKTQVSATLGAESLRQGLLAGAAGLVVVMIYLILFYRFLGLLADIALVAYAFIFYGIVVGMPVVMTLPGIAGMILTIGVAADANIIIFERIREEYRSGRSVPASIQNGFKKGLSTIVDANFVTIIAALVLFVIGSGTVRGFALLLGIGVLLSMFTAVLFTFALLGVLGGAKFLHHPAVIGGSRKELRMRFHWMNYRKIFYGITTAVVVGSLALLIGNGLNLGVDFKSGTKFDVRVEKDASPEDIRNAMAKVNNRYANATIQETSNPAGSGAKVEEKGSGFSIRVEKLAGEKSKKSQGEAAQDAEREVRKELDKQFGINEFNVQTIGPSFGQQIFKDAIIAIIVTIILLALYIAFRFEYKFALPVLVALAHDMIFAIGAYSITGREFKSATVAALLTILGYSLYDTIIVFDRIRENTQVMRKSSYRKIINASLNEVLTRSINTTLVVLMPISALFFFGGETLKDFAYALIVGIFAGSYSSLVVASPILCFIKERESNWQRRLAVEQGGGSMHETSAASNDSMIEGSESTVSTAPYEGAPPVQGQRDKRSRRQRKST